MTDQILDPKNLLDDRSVWRDVTIEVGCGPQKRYPGSIGIDSIAFDGVDLVGDALAVLRQIPDGSAQLVTSSHFLEHVPDVRAILVEMLRVAKVGGKLEVVVPHFSSPYYYSDPTHRTAFGLYSFSYLGSEEIFSRRVPRYAEIPGLKVVRADLVFKSNRPFYVRHGFKKVIGAIFNSTRYMRELYEENFCYIFPCYEIRFEILRTE